jgi:hypothetical protein
MRLRHKIGLRKIKFVDVRIRRDTARHQQRPHRAVGEQGPAGVGCKSL